MQCIHVCNLIVLISHFKSNPIRSDFVLENPISQWYKMLIVLWGKHFRASQIYNDNNSLNIFWISTVHYSIAFLTLNVNFDDWLVEYVQSHKTDCVVSLRIFCLLIPHVIWFRFFFFVPFSAATLLRVKIIHTKTQTQCYI